MSRMFKEPKQFSIRKTTQFLKMIYRPKKTFPTKRRA